MKKLISLAPLLVANLALAEGQTSGGLPPAALSRTGRTINYTVPVVRTLSSPLAAGLCATNTGTVVVDPGFGEDGLVANLPLGAVDHAYAAISQTTSVTLPLYAGRLTVDIVDDATGIGGSSGLGTITCSNLTLTGYRWDGERITEVNTAVTETAYNTTNSFSALTSVSAVCTGGRVSDALRIRSSGWIALPWRISKVSDIDAVCTSQLSSYHAAGVVGPATPKCITPAQFPSRGGSTTSFEADYTYKANAINVFVDGLGRGDTDRDDNVGTGCITDRASVTIRARANPQETRF